MKSSTNENVIVLLTYDVSLFDLDTAIIQLLNVPSSASFAKL